VVFEVNAPVVTEVPVPTAVPPQLPVYQCKVPVAGAAAVNVVVLPVHIGVVALTLVGSAGVVFTVNVHKLLVTFVLLLTTHDTIVVAVALLSVHRGKFPPILLNGAAAPVRHWYESGAVPVAATVKIACPPEHTA
jgi:hypothetical protein